MWMQMPETLLSDIPDRVGSNDKRARLHVDQSRNRLVSTRDHQLSRLSRLRTGRCGQCLRIHVHPQTIDSAFRDGTKIIEKSAIRQCSESTSVNIEDSSRLE